MKQNFFAVDLGATSGRTILGSFIEGVLNLEEINRFPNHLIEVGGHFYWDIYALYRHIIDGLKLVAHRGESIASIGIDTWGVDFVLLGKDGNLLRQPYAYRDPHTVGAPEAFFSRISRSEVYGKTGIQVMNFNSLFQLDTLRRNHDSALEAADKVLFMPDALSYMLTGKMVTEYTIASTAQLVNAHTQRLEPELLKAVGLKEENFGRFVFPGEKIGTLTEEVQKITGLGAIPVIAVAGHDSIIRTAQKTLSRGFTTVRHPGGITSNGFGVLDVKRAIEKGYITGSRIVAAPRFLCAAGSHGDLSQGFARNPELSNIVQNLRLSLGAGKDFFVNAVREEIKYGADFIKIMATGGFFTPYDNPSQQQMNDEELKAIMDTAHEWGKTVTAHVYSVDHMQKLIKFGIDGMEHCSLMDEETAQMIIDNDVYVVPRSEERRVGKECRSRWSPYH